MFLRIELEDGFLDPGQRARRCFPSKFLDFISSDRRGRNSYQHRVTYSKYSCSILYHKDICIDMYVCMYVCLYACMHVCMHACIYIYIWTSKSCQQSFRPRNYFACRPWLGFLCETRPEPPVNDEQLTQQAKQARG